MKEGHEQTQKKKEFFSLINKCHPITLWQNFLGASPSSGKKKRVPKVSCDSAGKELHLHCHEKNLLSR